VAGGGAQHHQPLMPREDLHGLEVERLATRKDARSSPARRAEAGGYVSSCPERVWKLLVALPDLLEALASNGPLPAAGCTFGCPDNPKRTQFAHSRSARREREPRRAELTRARILTLAHRGCEGPPGRPAGEDGDRRGRRQAPPTGCEANQWEAPGHVARGLVRKRLGSLSDPEAIRNRVPTIDLFPHVSLTTASIPTSSIPPPSTLKQPPNVATGRRSARPEGAFASHEGLDAVRRCAGRPPSPSP
jgi:hypothetical protein